MDEKDKILQQIIFELMFSTPQSRTYPDGLTAIELARKYNVKINIIKKNLRTLLDKGVVKCIGANPKFWLFDEYSYQRISEDDPIHSLLWNVQDMDFDVFFDY